MEKILIPFEWLIDHTFGYLIKLIFYLLNLILPESYTLIITKYADLFYQGIKYTLGISLFGTIIGFLIACLLSQIRIVKINKNDAFFLKSIKYISNSLVKIYVNVFRGTPMMVQAMILYYGLVGIIHWSPISAGLFIVSINTGAYLTEVVKNGIESVDKGQMEAARALGFSRFQAMILIVFPQTIKNSIASIGNEFVINIKDTSVLNVIGCAEMYYVLKTSSSEDFRFMEQMIVGAIIYLFLTFTITKILNVIERKLDVPVVELKGSN